MYKKNLAHLENLDNIDEITISVIPSIPCNPRGGAVSDLSLGAGKPGSWEAGVG